MALTITSASVESPGKGRTSPLFGFGARPMSVWVGEIDLDSSYPTGGETLDFTSAGLDVFRTVLGVFIESKGGYVFSYDYTNKKVIAYWVDTSVDGAAMAEVADTTDLATITDVRVLAIGVK